MLKVDCIPNTERRSSLSILIDGEPWRTIHTSIFGHRPSLPKECPEMELLIQAFQALEFRQAKQYALKRLSQMNMPSTSLAKSLQQKLVTPHTISRVINDLKNIGFLNDKEWIASFIRVQKNKKIGPKAIAQKLAMKGLSLEDLEDPNHEELLNSSIQSTEDQKTTIKHLLATRYRTKDLSVFKEKRKVIASLARRGFDLQAILDSMT